MIASTVIYEGHLSRITHRMSFPALEQRSSTDCLQYLKNERVDNELSFKVVEHELRKRQER